MQRNQQHTSWNKAETRKAIKRATACTVMKDQIINISRAQINKIPPMFDKRRVNPNIDQ